MMPLVRRCFTTALDTLAIGTDGTILIADTAGKHIRAVSEADGDLDLDCTQDALDTMYMQVVAPDGTLMTSDAITWCSITSNRGVAGLVPLPDSLKEI